MRNILFVILLMMGNVHAMNFQQQVQQSLKSTPAMDDRCQENIAYYEDKIRSYEAKYPNDSDYNAYMKAKLNYYYDELHSWEDYCYSDGVDPDIK